MPSAAEPFRTGRPRLIVVVGAGHGGPTTAVWFVCAGHRVRAGDADPQRTTGAMRRRVVVDAHSLLDRAGRVAAGLRTGVWHAEGGRRRP